MTAKRDTTFHVSYMRRALTDQTALIRDIRDALHGVKYDTIVVTGSSGMMIGPILARALRKKLLVVRKPAEYESSHSGMKWLGELGERWVFIDDFISSGETFRRVRDSIRDALAEINAPVNRWDWSANNGNGAWVDNDVPPFESELVGYVEYQKIEEGESFTRWEDAPVGFIARYWDDTPAGIAEIERQRKADEAADRELAERRQREADKRAEAEKSLGVEIISAPSGPLAPCGPNCIVCNTDLTPNAPAPKISEDFQAYNRRLNELAITGNVTIEPLSRVAVPTP